MHVVWLLFAQYELVKCVLRIHHSQGLCVCVRVYRLSSSREMNTKETWRGRTDSESECDIKNPLQSKPSILALLTSFFCLGLHLANKIILRTSKRLSPFQMNVKQRL